MTIKQDREAYGALPYVLECDECGEEAPERFESFEDARTYTRENKWLLRRNRQDTGWENVCPDCRDRVEERTIQEAQSQRIAQRKPLQRPRE